MTTHAFETTSGAYDGCQCFEEIANGDLLDIEPEGVVGLAFTWPVAVTANHGELHAMGDKPGGLGRLMADAGWSEEQVRAAVALASERGYEIAPAFQDYVSTGPAL